MPVSQRWLLDPLRRWRKLQALEVAMRGRKGHVEVEFLPNERVFSAVDDAVAFVHFLTHLKGPGGSNRPPGVFPLRPPRGARPRGGLATLGTCGAYIHRKQNNGICRGGT